MPRYKGTVTQSMLDWYAAQAMSAQQWFTQATPNYWSFSLLNNATDGRRLWVYDAEAVSGAAFPAGTGNPTGNPSGSSGYQGGGNIPTAIQLITSSEQINPAAGTLTQPAPAAIVAGNLIVMVMVGGNYAASLMSPPDSSWLLVASVDGNINTLCVAVWAHIATNSEPANYLFTYPTSPGSTPYGCAMQFSGTQIPGYLDVGAGNISISPSTAMVAPGLTLAQPGDMVVVVYYTFQQPQTTFTADPSLTVLHSTIAYSKRIITAYKLFNQSGAVGPFIGSTTPAGYFSTITVAFRAANNGLPPGQVISAPIASVTPVAPGVFSMNFSSLPLAFGGITRWLPPAARFAWHREAPLAVLRAGDQFNLAGISPENAAWGSVTWLAIK